MKIVDKIISKIGVDKVLHFLVGALVTALASMKGESYMYAAAMSVLVLSVGKEGLDETYDIWDIIAGCLGCGVSVFFYYGL